MKDFLREHRFDRVGIFTYSHEEGTSAHQLDVIDIPAAVKQKTCRVDVMEVQQEISSRQINQEKDRESLQGSGRIRRRPADIFGRTEFDFGRSGQ